jgi:CMP-N,N'-diacetyllegionaminic acid synthase
LKVLGVIPARGGSKRIPRKNLRELCGQPLIYWTIWAARQSKLDKFVVSTDDDEIAEVARYKCGAVVLKCEPGGRLHSDDCTSGEVLVDAMERMPGYDAVVCLHPTSPVRESGHIDCAIDLLRLNLPVASVKRVRPKSHQTVKVREGGLIAGVDGEEFFILNASIYAMSRSDLFLGRSHTAWVQVPLIMDDAHSVDIDTEEDFALAEFYLRRRLEAS